MDVPSDFALLRRTRGVVSALNEYWERHRSLPGDFIESGTASEACNLRGLLPAVNRLLHEACG